MHVHYASAWQLARTLGYKDGEYHYFTLSRCTTFTLLVYSSFSFSDCEFLLRIAASVHRHSTNNPMIDRVDIDSPVLPGWLSRSNRAASPGKNIPFADGSGSGRKMANMRLPNCWNDDVILIHCPSATFRYHAILSRIIDLGLLESLIFLLTLWSFLPSPSYGLQGFFSAFACGTI